MNKKEICALAMAGLLLLAGCGKKDNTNEEPTEETTAEAVTESEEETELVTEEPRGEEKPTEKAEKPQKPEEPVKPETPAKTEKPAKEEEPVITEEPKAADLAACKKEITANISLSDVSDVDKDSLLDMYGIDGGKVVQSACFVAGSDGAFLKEIVMIEATDEAAAADMEKLLKERLSAIEEQAASYEPDSASLAKASPVIRNGAYVAMFFASEHDAMKKIYKNYVK